jgi:DNA repair exonuclease SbcCD ATPase subunit
LHIHFTKVRYKNILSVGNHFIEIQLDKSPTTLITAPNGQGKCLRGSTEVEITFDDPETQKKFRIDLIGDNQNSYDMPNQETSSVYTVKQIADFYDSHPECIGKIKVETRFGYKTIEYADVTARDSSVLEVITETGKKIYTSPDHKLYDGEWIKTEDIKPGTTRLHTKDGTELVTSVVKLKDREDLYDLQVEEVKEFYANGFVSHNSTMIEAIVFALYGKPFRKITKPQLVNSINQKDLVVEIDFSIAADRYLIRRGIKPTIFEIWKNGEMLNKDAASRDYQAYLEQNILKMSLKSFSQIVILGSATYVPFMDLPAGQRREIIEDLLDIQVFSTMNTLLKDRITENKTAISENNYQIDLINTKIESAKDHNAEIERMKNLEIEKLRKKVAENLAKIEENSTKIEGIESEINDLLDKISDKSKQKKLQDQLRTLEYDLTSKQKQLSKDITFYSSHDNCPTCKQGISYTFKDSVLETCSSKSKELAEGLDQLKVKIEAVERSLSEISNTEDEINSLHSKANEYRLESKMLMNQMKSVKEDLINAEKEVEEIDQSKLQDFIKDLKILQNEQTDLYSQRETLGVVASMLKDGGIKTSIIRTYIPIMNKLINQYLSEFELFVDFNLDENFNETIKSRFRDTFSFGSFSEGEKMRISLSIMFTWRAISKLRNSVSTNLLFMDEVLDGSSDSEGVESLINILHKLNAKDNIFVISHRSDAFREKFSDTIQFTKVKNFTQIAA